MLPAHIELLHYVDCIDADRDKLRAAIPEILA
jgi:hypothetical protein